MKTKELIEDSFVKHWLLSINAKEETRDAYLQGMQAFTEWTGKTPEALILEAEQEIRTGALLRERHISTYIPEFRLMLENKGLAPLTVKGRLAAVTSFYKRLGIPIPALPESTVKARPELKRKEIPDKDDLREVLKACNRLEKAIVLVGVSSGLSAVDICNLKIKDFTNGLDHETNITTIHIVRQKTNYEFYTFLSPEATTAVQEYLQHRNRTGKGADAKRRRQLSKQYVTNDIGYLFISQAVSDEYLKTKNEKLRKLDQDGLLGIFRRVSEKAQKSAPKGEYNLVRSHNLRRFFNSALLNAGAPLFYVDFFLGHQIDRTHEAYYRPDPEKLKKEYAKYIPYITIEKPLDVSVSPEFKQVNEENKRLKAEIERVDVERSEIQQLKAEIEELKRAKQEREALKAEFEPFIKEYQKQVEKVEEVTGMNYEDASGYYNVAEIAPDSEKMKEHFKKLAKDPEYRKRYRTVMSGKLEKQEQEIGKKAVRVLGLKTLADELN